MDLGMKVPCQARPLRLHAAVPLAPCLRRPFTSHGPNAHHARISVVQTKSSSGTADGSGGPPLPPREGPPLETANSVAYGVWGKLENFVLGGNRKFDRARLAELGMGAFAAYGVISNLNASVLVTLSWLTIVKTQGVTPLAPGMWPKFLVVYGGFWISSHFMRPIRLSLALAAAPAFDAALGSIMRRTGFNKMGAFGVMLACIFFGSCAFLLSVLTLAGGFPLAPGPVITA